MLFAEICPELLDIAETVRQAIIAMQKACQCSRCTRKEDSLRLCADLIEAMALDYLEDMPEEEDHMPF